VTEPSHAVFLSYASQDTQAARRICEALRAAGIEVWFDQSELRGGDAWDQSIRKQIKTCALFIPVISRHTHDRAEGYFRLEWKLAVDRSHLIMANKAFLLPVVIDDTKDDDENVPDKFREVQWTRLPAGETPTEFAARVACLLTPESTTTSARQPSSSLSAITPATPLPIGTRWPKLAGVAILAVLACVAVYLVIQRPWVPRPATVPQPMTSLPTVPATTAAVVEKSIAVLPFVDMSEKHDQEYFGDGMAEEVLNLLAKLPEIAVIGRTSSFQFKGRNEDLRAIGVKLHAGYVVEGSVRRAGQRVRVTAQLIDTRSGTHVWSDSFDRDLGDVLALQQEISTSIARALQLAVGAEGEQSPRRLANKDAYALYLRGLYALDRVHPESLLQARSNFEQALALDPQFVRAAEALALTHYEMGQDEDVAPHLAWQRAKTAAERVLQLDANSATAHGVLGYVYGFDEFDWNKADAELTQALSLNPRNPVTLSLAAQVSHARGRSEEAAQRINASLAIDPLNPQTQQMLGFMLSTSGDFARAELAFRESLAISPGFDGSHYQIAEILVMRAQPEAALKELQSENAPDAKDGGLALAYYALGRKADSNAALERLTRADADLWPFEIAMVYAYRGAADNALAWAEKAYTLRDSDMLMRMRGHPFFEHLRSDPRYAELLRKMNLPE
jgi:TolB-like protein